MDKVTLKIMSMSIIPAILGLFTLLFVEQNIDVNCVWYETLLVRYIVVILSGLISLISIYMLITKKYTTIDSLQDDRDKRDIDRLTNTIENYLFEIKEPKTTEEIKEWVTDKYYKKCEEK